MPSHIDACLASARRCSQIAKKTRTLDDRSEFLSFAASWLRLANEIESNERLIALIDELAASTPPSEEAAPKFDEFTKMKPRREWSNWCVRIQPMRPNLPILPHSTLRPLTPRKDDAVTTAKKTIDRILSPVDSGLG